MPSVESLVLTNAIRHAADMRSSSYSPSYSSSSKDEHEYIDYKPKGKFRKMSEEEFEKMFDKKHIYILDFAHIIKNLVVPASVIFEKKFAYKVSVVGYDCGWRPQVIGEFMLEKNRWLSEYDLELSRKVKFIDQHTIVNWPYILSTDKESMKKVIDDIFSCDKWKGADNDMKKCQYDLLIKKLGL